MKYESHLSGFATLPEVPIGQSCALVVVSTSSKTVVFCASVDVSVSGFCLTVVETNSVVFSTSVFCSTIVVVDSGFSKTVVGTSVVVCIGMFSL